jgi:hypothetical protein
MLQTAAILIKTDTIYKVLNDSIVIINTINLTPTEPKEITFWTELTSPGTLIALFAVVVSFFFAWRNIIYNRVSLEKHEEHSKLSVKPFLSFFYKAIKDNSMQLELQNNGLGGAIINSLTFKYNDEYFDTFNGVLQDYLSIERYNQIIDTNKSIFLFKIEKEDSISIYSGKKLVIFRAYSKSDYQDFIAIMNDIKYDLIISVEYESIYMEKQITTFTPN